MAGGRSTSRNSRTRSSNVRNNNARNNNGSSGKGATSHRSTSRGQQSGNGFHVPGWLWGIVGLIAGFAGAQYFQASAPKPERGQVAAVVARQSSDGQSNQQAAEGKQGKSAGQQDSMPTFEFYTLLPESEVVAPTVDAYHSTPRPGTQAAIAEQNARRIMAGKSSSHHNTTNANDDSHGSNATASSDTPRYVLQAASFRDSSDARKMAGRLKDLGMKARVSEVTTADNTRWYRVQVGPYQDTREISRARDLMATQHIEPMLIQLQG